METEMKQNASLVSRGTLNNLANIHSDYVLCLINNKWKTSSVYYSEWFVWWTKGMVWEKISGKHGRLQIEEMNSTDEVIFC